MVGESPNLCQAALGYAAKGWPVFPCQPRSKQPLTDHGFHDASTDIIAVEEWWFRWPSANIGTPTGIAFDVVDFDTDALYWAHFPLSGPQVRTGRGYHWYIRPTGRNGRVHFETGVDFQGIGKYVVLPPSRHPNGSQYRWIAQESLECAPDWLISAIMPRDPAYRPHNRERPRHISNKAVKSVRTMCERLASMPEGGRNNYLFVCACNAMDTGFAPDEIALMFRDAATLSGLAAHEIEATIDSALRRWQ